jgi:hypothetical protein
LDHVEKFFFYFIVSAEHLLLENQDSASVTEKRWLVDGYHKVKCIENPPFRKFATFSLTTGDSYGCFGTQVTVGTMETFQRAATR